MSQATCRDCLKDFDTSDLHWSSEANWGYLCLDCVSNREPEPVYCGDCLRPLTKCEHGGKR